MASDRIQSALAESLLDACWLLAPPEGSGVFFYAFRSIAKSVQRALRFQLPAMLFRESESLGDMHMAYPILIYASSRPYRSRSRSELTYDVLDRDMMESFYRLCKPGLRARLAGIVERLQREGLHDMARRYLPRRALDIIAAVRKGTKTRHRLHSLLFAEANLINELTHLGGLGQKDEEAQARTLVSFAKAWNSHLRRMSGPEDSRELSEVLIGSAEGALRRELDLAASRRGWPATGV